MDTLSYCLVDNAYCIMEADARGTSAGSCQDACKRKFLVFFVFVSAMCLYISQWGHICQPNIGLGTGLEKDRERTT